MTGRRLLLVLAPAGTLAAHGLAYGPFGGHGDGAGLHAYVPYAAAVAVPGAIGALLWATTGRRGRTVRLPTVRALVVTQLGLFGVQEIAERVVSRLSLSDLASQPAVRCGLALQVFTAAACLLAARLLRRTVGAFLSLPGRAGRVVDVSSVLVAVVSDRRIAEGRVWRAPARAPPVVAS
ncbi:MAG: hypothetical protein QOH79_1016 [Acidimicrobiaceae bacterium]